MNTLWTKLKQKITIKTYLTILKKSKHSLPLKNFILILILSLPSSVSFGNTIEIMSYNVENLFDADHDVENDIPKDDWAFLPKSYPGKREACLKIKVPRYQKQCLLTDWSDEKLNSKIDNLVFAIKKGRQQVPDMIGLVEVENEKVVQKLIDKLGVKNFVMTHSPDKRGIDCALAFKDSEYFKFVSSRELVLDAEVFSKRPTRNILEVEFSLFGGEKLFVFVNHWPSLSNSNETRLIAAQTLRKRILEIFEDDPKNLVVAMGDFNTVDSLHPHPFKDFLLKETPMVDLVKKYFNAKNIPRYEKEQFPPGTYFYSPDMQWNDLDRFFVSKAFLEKRSGWRIKVDTFEIHAPKEITRAFRYRNPRNHLSGSVVKGVPQGNYYHKGKFSGYSDHFPVVFKLSY